MDDALLVRRFERFCDLLRDGQRFVQWNRSARYPLGEVFALDELHDQRTDAVRLFEAMDVSDVGMVQRRECLGFAREPRQPVEIARESFRQRLQRHITIQFRVAGAIHLPHAAFANLSGDLEDAEAHTGRKGHRVALDYTGKSSGAPVPGRTKHEEHEVRKGRRLSTSGGIYRLQAGDGDVLRRGLWTCRPSA